MAQQFLDAAEVRSSIEQVRREAVSEFVRAKRYENVRRMEVASTRFPYCAAIHASTQFTYEQRSFMHLRLLSVRLYRAQSRRSDRA